MSHHKENIKRMREAYERKFQTQLEELLADFKKLKAKADQAEADAQLEY